MIYLSYSSSQEMSYLSQYLFKGDPVFSFDF